MRGRVALAAGTGLLLLTACSSGVREVVTSPSSSAPTSAGSSPSGTPTSTPASPSATPTGSDAAVVFHDDFRSKGSGWGTEKLPSGTQFLYGINSYVVIARGGGNHTQYAPHQAIARPGATATFALPRSAPAGTAVGVTCRGGPDSAGMLSTRSESMTATATLALLRNLRRTAGTVVPAAAATIFMC